nr:histidine phosphatase family protein [uncultured Marinococcus sp.]
MKNLYIVRHCEALGQESDAPLTDEGLKQANDLAAFFKDLRVEKLFQVRINVLYKR